MLRKRRRIDKLSAGDVSAYCQTSPKEIGVNIQKIYASSHYHIDRFTKQFAKAYAHELIHILINEELGKGHRNQLVEESYIRMMLYEKFPLKDRKVYK